MTGVTTRLERAASIYSLVIGISMLGLWIMLISTSSVEEFDTRPVEIVLHITAEAMTGVLLILSGFAMWKGFSLRHNMFFLSIGMLLYTSIVSPGYYADRGEWPIVAAFAVLILSGIALAGSMLLSISKRRNHDELSSKD
ncbi:MAG: hypothetical protein ACMUHY_08205 [Thermoplasmatota archaeon]